MASGWVKIEAAANSAHTTGMWCTSPSVRSGVSRTNINHSGTYICLGRCWNLGFFTGLLSWHIIVRRKIRVWFLQITKTGEKTGKFQPRYYVGGLILDVHHRRTMFSLTNVENEYVHSSCTPYCALPVHRFSVCEPYISNFDKERDWGYKILSRTTNNGLKYSCTMIKQWPLFNSKSVYPSTLVLKTSVRSNEQNILSKTQEL